jgi:hypothetical protein
MKDRADIAASAAAAFCSYPKDARDAGEGWRSRTFFEWVDAVTWIATQSAPLARLLAAHRHLMLRGERNPVARLTPDEERAAIAAGHPGNRLGRSGWHYPPVWIVEPRSPVDVGRECAIIAAEHVKDGDALNAAGEALRHALAAGKAAGRGRREGKGEPVEVPRESWAQGFAHTKTDDGRAALTSDTREIWYSDLVVTAADILRLWPDSSAPKSNRGRKSMYDWAAFEKQAIERLKDEGGFMDGVWQQTQLEAEMATWCEDRRWIRIPGESAIRDHIKIAEAAYLASKTAN